MKRRVDASFKTAPTSRTIVIPMLHHLSHLASSLPSRFTGKFGRRATLMFTASAIFLLAAGVRCQEQSFPLKPGVWEATSSPTERNGRPVVLRYCLNDQTWPRALNNSKKCQVAQFSETSAGAHFFLECSMKTVQMKGPVRLTFDGKEHMTQKASLALTFGGRTTNVTSLVDFRWKAATCTGHEINLTPPSGD